MKDARMSNESAVCAAVCGFLSLTTGETVQILSKPDLSHREKKSVDFLIGSTTRRWAVEHTRIESFENQIKTDRKLAPWARKLEETLIGTLPQPGRYVLIVDCETFSSCKIRERKKASQSVAAWVRSSAVSLPIGNGSRIVQLVKGGPPQLPFLVQMYRMTTVRSNQGSLRVSLTAPEDLQYLRKARIRRSLTEKCPKLQQMQSKDEELLTILVLESNDLSLANYIDIGRAVAEELPKVSSAPNEIFLVETELPPWTLWILKRGRYVFPNVENNGPFELTPRKGGLPST
jgi:hypothetical protein